MSVKVALRTWLLRDRTVNELCGKRVFPVERPPATPLPAITYQRIVGGKTMTLTSPQDTTTAHFQLDLWANTWDEADQLARAIVGNAARQGIVGFRGEIVGLFLQRVALANEYDLPEPAVDGSGRGLGHVVLELAITYEDR